MKKRLLFALLILFSPNLFSQIEKGNILISVGGNYVKNNSEDGVSTNLVHAQVKNLTLNSNIGYMVTNNLIVGAGLYYLWEKETRTNQIYFKNTFQVETMKVKSNAILPGIFLGYYYPVIKNLYVNAKIDFNYGIIRTKLNAEGAYVTRISTVPDDELHEGTIDDSGHYGFEDESGFDLFSTGISPEISYFITPRFALDLRLGGIEYLLVDWKNDSSAWSVNFNPTNWRLGFSFRL